jgi:ferredoxin-fold anticodon binding domain-containing protein
MRTIKFRGLRVDGKGWVYGSFIHNNIDCPCIIDIDAEQYEVISESVGQFTGLIDVDGKEIYEGDTVQAPWRYTKDKIVSLIFDEDFFYDVREYCLEDVLKITGNIHEK